MEIWKDIVWYEGLYQVSTLWNIKSFKKNRGGTDKAKLLKQTKGNHWYLVLNLCYNWKVKYYLAHKLILQSFIPNPENKPFINHKNWIRNDNRVENLEWVTRSENDIHKFRVLWYKNHFQTNHPTLWKFWKNHHSSKSVNQYDLQGNFIKNWGCTLEVQRELWINNWNISSCCTWRVKTAWWFIWKYV